MHAPPSRSRSFLKLLAAFCHQLLRGSRPLSRLYFSLVGRISRILPDGPWKGFVANSLAAISWPVIDLSPVRAVYPDGYTAAVIVPHIGEFDFQLHFSPNLAYEPEVFSWLANRQYSTIIEIGANVGVFSLFLAKRFPGATVYCFEPSRQAYGRLLANLERNPDLVNLIPSNCAIYSRSGFVSFHEPVGHLTNGSLDENFAKLFGSVRSNFVAALESSCLEPLLERAPFLLKIDVEGAEPEVLQSLSPILAKYRPDVIVEVLPTTAARLNELAWIAEQYRLFSLQPAGPVERESFQAALYRDYALVPR